MFVEQGTEVEALRRLYEEDWRIAESVAAAGCSHCKGGRLHFAAYERRPRFGHLVVPKGLDWGRFSLCCGSCRKRTLPPSMVFLGRKVYVELTLVFASLLALRDGIEQAAEATGVPDRTIQRWLSYWRELVPSAAWWRSMRALLSPPPADDALPTSLVERVTGVVAVTGEKALTLLARLLAPGTTPMRDAARFVRAIVAPKEHPPFRAGDGVPAGSKAL
jgi:hypothetical protein